MVVEFLSTKRSLPHSIHASTAMRMPCLLPSRNQDMDIEIFREREPENICYAFSQLLLLFLSLSRFLCVGTLGESICICYRHVYIFVRLSCS